MQILKALKLSEQNLLEYYLKEKLDICLLSLNPSAMHLLERNKNKIDWIKLSLNPSAIHLL
jgi:hypothetical protein